MDLIVHLERVREAKGQKLMCGWVGVVWGSFKVMRYADVVHQKPYVF